MSDKTKITKIMDVIQRALESEYERGYRSRDAYIARLKAERDAVKKAQDEDTKENFKETVKSYLKNK